MIQKIKKFIITKETLLVFILFLLFPMIRTQVINLSYIIFDFLFLDGILDSIYKFNYKGKLLGCEQILKLNGLHSQMSIFHKEGLYFLQYIPSLIAFILLARIKSVSRFNFWLLVMISCISILSAIIMSSFLIKLNLDYSSIKNLRNLISTIIFIIIGVYIFLRIFTNKDRVLVVFIAFPAFIVGSIFWLQYLGPKLLPVII